MDSIIIKNLRVKGFIGVFDFEKRDGQDFLVNLEIFGDFSKAGKTDELRDALDYGSISYDVSEYFESSDVQLLEKATEDVAMILMKKYDGIKALDVTIAKPDAPVNLEFEYLGVKRHFEWTKVAASIGSNMGDKEAYLNAAIEAILDCDNIKNVCVSKFIETEPYGYENQDKFLNGALTFETLLSPQDLLRLFNKIEADANRVREIHWGPRTLDMDILLYGNQIIESKDLIIPHIDMTNRTFVLEPLAEIAPGMVHPLKNKTIIELLKDLK